MLSARGAAWAKADYLHGKEDVYDPIHNPNGVVSFYNAENVSRLARTVPNS
jgi:1-aminocyclopropane-1-carboxylate synthase